MKNIHEKEDLKSAKVLIYETVNTYANKALSNGNRYKIKFYYNKKCMDIYYANKMIEKINLPKKLNYTILFKNKGYNGKFDFDITKNGNTSTSFSIYIFDYSKIARYRLSFISFQTIKYLKINIYENTNKNFPKYKEIKNFNDKWEEKYKKNWKKI